MHSSIVLWVRTLGTMGGESCCILAPHWLKS